MEHGNHGKGMDDFTTHGIDWKLKMDYLETYTNQNPGLKKIVLQYWSPLENVNL